MCNGRDHPDLTYNPDLSRRAVSFGAAALVALAASGASGQEKVVERDVNVKTSDGVADGALFHPGGKGAWPAVLIWTDVLGLRAEYRELGHRLATEGYVVLIPNFYYRVRKAPVIDGPFDFSNKEDWAKLAPLHNSVTRDGIDRDTRTLVAFLDAQKRTNTKAKVGVHGYCMGGWMAFHAAAALPERVGAMATFHGGDLATDSANSPHLLIPKIRAEAYCAVADDDDRHAPGETDRLKAAFDSGNVPSRVEVYKGANHGWCVKSFGTYNEAASERAWSELVALYRKTLI